MKVKFGNLSVSQLSRICETMPNCAECPFQNVCAEQPYGYLTDEYVEIDLPDEVGSVGEGNIQHKKDMRAVQSLGEYDLCDQWVCPKCGIEIQDYVEIERDEDDGEEIRHEYCPKFCPECGIKIIDPDEEEITDGN